MTTPCQQIDDLLFESSREALEQAARHARACPACAENLRLWNEISDTARTMRAEWTSDLLWPRIERSIRAQKKTQWTGLWRAAAVLLMTAGLAGLTWYAVARRAGEREFERVILRQSALEQVENAEQQHLTAIEQLEKVAGSKVDQPTPLMVSYREKLMLLDDAIAECQAAIEENRQNAHLRRQLLALYTEKQRTLQDILREETDASNQ